jgi:hypothetical protein
MFLQIVHLAFHTNSSLVDDERSMLLGISIVGILWQYLQ